jgi:hypothetical protein
VARTSAYGGEVTESWDRIPGHFEINRTAVALIVRLPRIPVFARA